MATPEQYEAARQAVLNDAKLMGEVADELRALWKAALEREGHLVSAVADVMWKATPYGQTDDGDVYAYIVPKGCMHRLIGVAQQNGANIPVAFRAIVPPVPGSSDRTEGFTTPREAGA